jgi:hypothetical protein
VAETEQLTSYSSQLFSQKIPLPSGGFLLDGLFQQPFALGVM